ncbi:transglutaminase-like domain-containing protein [Neotabrizicola sp. VNH66]|uniref:transglutaminase-like domain-containing protein n=1 Tax=Neotabrizicola sp. VNH66 TaxID=3400918 RepID=UPI003C0664E5
MIIRYGYVFTLNFARPAPVVTMVSARPEHGRDLIMPERHWSSPVTSAAVYRDDHGNICRRFMAPEGELTLAGEGLIRNDGAVDPVAPGARPDPVESLPHEVLPYLRASRYVESDAMGEIAWDLFGAMEPGWETVQAICDFVHGHIEFGYGEACATRTALQALEERKGVCRDFAHVMIGLCRALNIPARYINGHLGDIGVAYNPDPMDYAAWVEVWMDGRWHTFDPRNNARRIGRIVVAHGRDAADVPMLTSFGAHELTAFRVIAEETPPSGSLVPFPLRKSA